MHLTYLHANEANVWAGTSLILTFLLLGLGKVFLSYLLGITNDTVYLHQVRHVYISACPVACAAKQALTYCPGLLQSLERSWQLFRCPASVWSAAQQ